MCKDAEQFAEVNASIVRGECIEKSCQVMEKLTEVEKLTTLIDALLKYEHTALFLEMHQSLIEYIEKLRSIIDPLVELPDEINDVIEQVIKDMGFTTSTLHD
jgi:hypothetical protein